ncbi:MAG: hypothetical protein ACFFD4_03900 [Candidatus Odinarchaeota archaeon]
MNGTHLLSRVRGNICRKKSPISYRSGVTFQFHETRGLGDVLVVKALYPPVDGIRRLFWVFVAAYLVEVKNVSNPKLLLNIASHERVSLVRWVDIYKYSEINPKSSRFNKDRTIPGLGVVAVLTVPVELTGGNARTRRSLTNPFRKIITSKLATDDKRAVRAAKDEFLAYRDHLISLIKATGSLSTALSPESVLNLFRNINCFDYKSKAFFRDHEILKKYLALDSVPHVPFVDFPYQQVPVALPVGISPLNSTLVGFSHLIDRRLLIAGGSSTERMFLALKFAASTGLRVLVLDLQRGTENISAHDWQAVLANCATVYEPGNDCNINAFSLTAPNTVSTASVTAYKADRMSSYLIHSSDMDEYYRIGDHVRSLFSAGYGSAGTNTITCNKLLELIESGLSALRPNSQQEELVTVLVDSFKDYPEINAPVAVPVTSLVRDGSFHSWIRFTYQSLPVRRLVTLWVLHEMLANGLEGYCLIINGLDNLAHTTNKANKYQLINEEIRSLLDGLAGRNVLVTCSDRISSIHDNIFLSLKNAMYLRTASDNDWEAIRKKHGFTIESSKFETLKKLENQAVLFREDRLSTPFVLWIGADQTAHEMLEHELVRTSRKEDKEIREKTFAQTEAVPSRKLSKYGFTDKFTHGSSRGSARLSERYFNRTGIEDPSLDLPSDMLNARAFLEISEFLADKQSAGASEIELLLTKLIDPSYQPMTRKKNITRDPLSNSQNNTFAIKKTAKRSKQRSESLNSSLPEELAEGIKRLASLLAKSNFFSVQFIEKRHEKMNWSLKQQGAVFYEFHRENYRYLLLQAAGFTLTGASIAVSQLLDNHSEVGTGKMEGLLISDRYAREDLFKIFRQLLSWEYQTTGQKSWKTYVFLNSLSRELQELSKHHELDRAITLLETCLQYLQQLLLDQRKQPVRKPASTMESVPLVSDSNTIADRSEQVVPQSPPVEVNDQTTGQVSAEILMGKSEVKLSDSSVPRLSAGLELRKNRLVELDMLGTIGSKEKSQRTPAGRHPLFSTENPSSSISSDDRSAKIGPGYLKNAPAGWPFSVPVPSDLEGAVEELRNVSVLCNQEEYPVTSILVMKAYVEKYRLNNVAGEQLAAALDSFFDYQGG